MREKEKTWEEIENYLSGQMSAQEKDQFEKRLAGEEILKKDVEEYTRIQQSFKNYGQRLELKSKIKSIAETHKKSNPFIITLPRAKRSSLAQTIGIAAGLALVISLSSYLVLSWFGIFNKGHRDDYRELKREVSQMKKTQSKMISEINKDKQKFQIANFRGTGLAVGKNGYILTSLHLLKDAVTVYAENEKYGRLKLVKVFEDPALDIAIMKVNDSTFQSFSSIPFSLKKDNPKLGENVFILGYPKDDIVYGEGYVSSTNGYEGDTASLQFSIPVNPGNSGGPVIDAQGNLAGIVSGKHDQQEGSAFAIKAKYLKSSLQSKDSVWAELNLNSGKKLKGDRISNIEKVKENVFLISVYQD